MKVLVFFVAIILVAWQCHGSDPLRMNTGQGGHYIPENKPVFLGIKIVFITGRPLAQQDVTAKNLKTAGFHTWEKVKDIVGLACVPAKRTVPKVTHH
ncbi:hypothetical protein JHK85_017698 [Glycine max]|nr:hypothetical protein JHK85_017698 [Glycine max]